jgi:hypothetical protein
MDHDLVGTHRSEVGGAAGRQDARAGGRGFEETLKASTKIVWVAWPNWHPAWYWSSDGDVELHPGSE